MPIWAGLPWRRIPLGVCIYMIPCFAMPKVRYNSNYKPKPWPKLPTQNKRPLDATRKN